MPINRKSSGQLGAARIIIEVKVIDKKVYILSVYYKSDKSDILIRNWKKLKKYNRTITVCDGKLFVELYHHNFIDVGYEYLTDSTNFRIDVGKFDNEHGFSVIIIRVIL